jgi:hypothetical protein
MQARVSIIKMMEYNKRKTKKKKKKKTRTKDTAEQPTFHGRAMARP